MMDRWVRALPFAAALLAATGCPMLWSTPTPIPSLSYDLDPAAPQQTLVVLLPGIGSGPEEFAENGFVDEVRRRQLPVDLLALDAHLGYYAQQTLRERILEDVVRPARERGYARIWLVGISMGAIGASLYAEAHGDTVDGLLLLAIGVDDGDLPGEIAAAGGLRAWSPEPVPAPEEDWERAIWYWLRGYGAEEAAGRPPLWFGYGTEDRFAEAHRLLAEVLPADRVLTTPGDHDWGPWLELWKQFLDAGALAPPPPSP